MFFTEYEFHKILKLRQEEIERKAHNAWKYQDAQKESFLQNLFKKWINREKLIAVQQNCGCACEC